MNRTHLYAFTFASIFHFRDEFAIFLAKGRCKVLVVNVICPLVNYVCLILILDHHLFLKLFKYSYGSTADFTLSVLNHSALRQFDPKTNYKIRHFRWK